MNKLQKLKEVAVFLVWPAIWMLMQWKFAGKTPNESICYAKAIGISLASLVEQPGTLVSYAVLHRDWTHLFINLVLYVVFAPALIVSEKPEALIVTMLAGAVAGAATSVLYLLPHGDVVVGSDGAVYAVVVASTIVAPGRRGLLVRPKSFFCIALLVAAGYPVSAPQTALDAIPVLELAGAAAGACGLLVLVTHAGKNDYKDNVLFILLGVYFGHQAWKSGSSFMFDLLNDSIILPWNAGGQWNQWLWAVGGSFVVLWICENLALPGSMPRPQPKTEAVPDTTETYPFLELEKQEV